MPTIRRLVPTDVASFRRLRLSALQESPTAFSATADGVHHTSDAQIQGLMKDASHGGIWGAWNAQQELVGLVGLRHQLQAKLQHKASLYTVYVAPSARGTGLGRQLLETAIRHARQHADLRQLLLGVTAGNTAALRLYQSLGFVEYGHEPEALCVDGRYYDEILMRLALHS